MVADHQVGRHRRAGAVSRDEGLRHGHGRQDGLDHRLDRRRRPLRRDATCAARRKSPDPRPRPGAGARRCRTRSSGQGAANPLSIRPICPRLPDVRQLADAVLADHQRLDVFVSNAGIGSQNDGPARQTSADGHELRFAVNYLAGLPARPSPAAAVEGERAVAHRQCRLARPASDRFRRCHDHARATTAAAPMRRASCRRSCSRSISPRS